MSLETKLGNEISVDPLGRGYSGMTDQEVLDDLGTEYIEEDVDTVEGQEIFEATILSELNVLSSKQLQIYMGIIGMSTIQVNGANTKAALLDMFGVGTDTRTNLQALQKRMISRLVDLGIPGVKIGHVEMVRA